MILDITFTVSHIAIQYNILFEQTIRNLLLYLKRMQRFYTHKNHMFLNVYSFLMSYTLSYGNNVSNNA